MNCPTCEHGVTRCLHPLVAPFDGEPPSRLGSAIVDWRADHVRPASKDASAPRRGAPPCPGFSPGR